MKIIFNEKYLEVLYYEGKDDKKHRFQPQIIKKYQYAIGVLKNAGSTEELYQYIGLRYKVLQGDKAGISSVRVNDQYRIEFKVEESTIIVCNILELSKHYGD